MNSEQTLTFQWLTPLLIAIVGFLVGIIGFMVKEYLSRMSRDINEVKIDLREHIMNVSKYMNDNSNHNHNIEIRLTKLESVAR